MLKLVFVSSYEQHFFLLEIFLSVLAPLGLLLVPKIRESAQGLYLAAVLTLLGFVTNRLNVAITGVENAVGARYTPKWTEVVITAMFVALGFRHLRLGRKIPAYLPRGEGAHPGTQRTRSGSKRIRGACSCWRLTTRTGSLCSEARNPGSRLRAGCSGWDKASAQN